MKRSFLFIFIYLMQAIALKAEDGYRLWLRYDKIENQSVLQKYQLLIHSFYCTGTSPTKTLIRKELQNGLTGLLGKKIEEINSDSNFSVVVCTSVSNCNLIKEIDR